MPRNRSHSIAKWILLGIKGLTKANRVWRPMINFKEVLIITKHMYCRIKGAKWIQDMKCTRTCSSSGSRLCQERTKIWWSTSRPNPIAEIRHQNRKKASPTCPSRAMQQPARIINTRFRSHSTTRRVSRQHRRDWRSRRNKSKTNQARLKRVRIFFMGIR